MEIVVGIPNWSTVLERRRLYTSIMDAGKDEKRLFQEGRSPDLGTIVCGWSIYF